jgi:uncharacterized membrane protein
LGSIDTVAKQRLDSKIVTAGTQQAREHANARINAPGLDSADRRLSHARSLGKFPLGEASVDPGAAQ